MVETEEKEDDDENDGNDRMVGKEIILFNKVVQGEVGEETGIRDTEEEEDLFERKSADAPANGIAGVEAPYSQVCKNNVPSDKHNRCD